MLPQNPSPKKGNVVLCSFHRSHREICTRNRPLFETNYLDYFWGPLALPAPLCFTADQMKIFHVGSHQFREWLQELLRENCGFRIAQVVRCHSENGMLHAKNQFLNSKSCSESTPELSQSSKNDLFTPRAFFVELGWSPASEFLEVFKKGK